MHVVGQNRIQMHVSGASAPWGKSSRETDPYEELSYAIVIQAMIDWLAGQKKIESLYGVKNLQELKEQFPDKDSWHKVCVGKVFYMMDAERFFKSNYCEDICGIDGRIILSRLKAGKTLNLDRLTKGYHTSRKKQAS